MNRSMLSWVTSRSPNDQPLTKAARVALEVDLTPRVLRYDVDHDGQPIEKPNGEPRPQIELPI